MLDNFNPLKELFTLAGKAVDAKAAQYAGAAFGGNGEQSPGVDEYGRVYLRGQPSAALGSIDPRLLMVGAGILAVVLVVYLAKN